MKQYILTLAITLIIIQCQAQNIKLYLNNSLITTDTVEVTGNTGADTLYTYIFQGDTTYYYAYEAVIDIDVKNASSNSMDIQCRKRHIKLVSETQNYFCWGSCFPPYTFESINPLVIPANTTDTAFAGHYKPNGKLGCTIVAYTFFDNNNPSDSATVTVKYIMDSCTPSSIIENNNSVNMFSSAYPNPASSYFNIDIKHLQKTGYLNLYNNNGQLIKTKIFYASNTNIAVNIKNLQTGIYFYNIILNDLYYKSGKIIKL